MRDRDRWPWSAYGGQKTTCSTWLSPSALWVPGIELRLSDLLASKGLP